jgi:hypothetical protein
MASCRCVSAQLDMLAIGLAASPIPVMVDGYAAVHQLGEMLLQRFFPQVIAQREAAITNGIDKQYCQFNSQVRCCPIHLAYWNIELTCTLLMGFGPIFLSAFCQGDGRVVSWGSGEQACSLIGNRQLSYIGRRLPLLDAKVNLPVQVLQLWQSSMYLAGAVAGKPALLGLRHTLGKNISPASYCTSLGSQV